MKKPKDQKNKEKLPRGRYVTKLSSIWEEFIQEARKEAAAEEAKNNKEEITYH